MRRKGVEQPSAEHHVSPAEAFTISSQRFLAELRRELLNTRDAIREEGDHVAEIKSPFRPASSPNTLKGFSIRETSGSATALVYFRDGKDANAPMVSVVSLAAGESARDYFGDRGISLLKGLFVDVASGAVEGSVYLGTS